MKHNKKSLLIVVFAILHVFLFTVAYFQFGFSSIKAENVLTDSGTLDNQGDQVNFNFTLPENVQDVTIEVYGDAGTDFDIIDIQHPENSYFSYYSETRDSESESFTIQYPYSGDWNFSVNFPYDSNGTGGNFLVYVDYNLITDPDPDNVVLSRVDQLDSYSDTQYFFSTPQNATRIAIDVISDTDIQIGDVCGRYYCDTMYYTDGDPQYMEIVNPEYQEWVLNIYSNDTPGGFRVIVHYEVNPEPSVDVYNISDTVFDFGTNSHSFDFSGTAKKLIVSLIAQEAINTDLRLTVYLPGFAGQITNSSQETYYKTLVINNPETGTYNIEVNEMGDDNSVDYEVKVFTQDFEEYSEAVAPLITSTASNRFNDATTANLSIDVEPTDNMVLVFASYKSYGYGMWSNYIGYIGDQNYWDLFRKVETYPRCYSVLTDLSTSYDMVSEVWYYYGKPEAGTLDFSFNFQGSESDIRDLVLSAVTISNANPDNMEFSDYSCQAKSDINTSNFLMPINSKANDLVIGSIYTDTNTMLVPSYGSTIYSYNVTGASFVSSYDTTTEYELYTPGSVDKYIALAVAVRANGPVLSPNSYTYVPGGSVEDLENPVIGFTTSPGSMASNGVQFVGTVTDDVAVDYAEYQLNEDSPVSITLDGDSNNKSFDFTIPYINEGTNTVIVTAYDYSGKFVSQEFVFDFVDDQEDPFCDLPSQNSVVNSNTVTYTNVICTDDVGIEQLQLTVYKDNLFTELYNGFLPEDVTQDDSFGDAEEIVTFTIPIELPDGIIFVRLNPRDVASKDATYIGSDFFTVEAEDSTAPTLYLEAIRPDPTMDDSPRITGSCSDNSLYDTNSVVSQLRYRLDEGSWQDITPLDGDLGEIIEEYSFDLPTLSLGTHTVEVECSDSQALVTTKSDEFTIIAPVLSEPQLIIETEDFNDHTNHVLSESNLIWGNGRLRLRETISTVRTSIDTTNYPTKYQNTGYNKYLVEKDPTNSNRIWYTRTSQVVSYDISTGQSTVLDPVSWGLTNLDGPMQTIELSVLNGKTYLWTSDLYRLQVYNLTDNVAVEISYYQLGSIVPDTRGRLAAYINVGGTVGYLDLNNTLTNTGDDTYTVVSSLPDGSALGLSFDFQRNELYVPRYGIGLAKLNDNNTPTNFGDDTLAEYSNAQFENNGSVFGVLVDPNGYLLVGMAGYNQTGGLYVVLDSHTTPGDASDDTVLKLADSAQIKNLNVYDITYIEGQNDVGDQLFLTGELGDAYYLNFNDTYTDLLDDTYIRLNITTNNRGVDTSNAYRGSAVYVVQDYNTLYVNGDVDGFQKYDLIRGWQDVGQAVIYSTPENRLFANYFELRDVQDVGVITVANSSTPEQDNNLFTKLKNLLFPKVTAQQLNGAVSYFVSVDDGVTWNPITLAEILNMSQNDYRVKFKIEMTEINDSTPVIDSYTLAFGAYQDEEQADTYTLDLNVLPNTGTTADNLNFTAKVVDELGFSNQNFNGGLVINLIDSVTSTTKNTLINYGNIELVNGEFSVNNLRITAPGTYYISALYDSVVYLSNLITITEVPVTPVPTINFTANKTTINLGESVTLNWTTSNLTALSINRGVGTLNSLNGSTVVTPTTTTAYTLTGTGPYGNLESTLTIVVVQPTTTNTPSPDTNADDDNDGLTNQEEISLGTNPNDSDSDDDGLLDGEEVDGCVYNQGTTECSSVTFEPTDPLDANTDNDSLLDGEEVLGCYFTINTTVCSNETFEPTDPHDPNSPATHPVAENNPVDTSVPTPTVAEPTAEEPTRTIIETVVEAFNNSAKTGSLPTALVVTTTAATALTAVSYPNAVMYAFVWFRKRRKKLSWGLVFDATNNKPVPFVTVRILDMSNQFIAEEISDLNGKYSIAAKSGNYLLEAKVNGYEEFRNNIAITDEAVNIDIALTPVDPKYDKWLVLRNWLKNNMPKINTFIFFIGFIFSLITMLVAPNTLNLVVLIVFIVQIAAYYLISRNKGGRVFEANSGENLKGIFVRIFEKESGRQLGSVVTDNLGKYNLFLKPGSYLIKAENLQYKIEESTAKFKDATGVPYMEVNLEKESLLNIQIPMQRKTYQEMGSNAQSKFGMM